MSFVFYDLTFLVLFTLFVVIFLYTHRHNLQRQGILYLYRTTWGIRLIEKVSNRYKGFLKPLQYLVVACGYALMAIMIWLLIRIVRLYTVDQVITATKIPPIAPLIPYLPSLFKADYLPPLYFTYWIVILAIVAISHEFAHGIFARVNNIKVKATGFGFLGPFLAAFVEPDEKHMQKAKKFPQLAILAAGTFANILMTILFGLVLLGFFALSFTPAGVIFSTYSTTIVNSSDIVAIGGMPLAAIELTTLNSSLYEIQTINSVVYSAGTTIAQAIEQEQLFYAFEDSPAFQARLSGAITSLDGVTVTNAEELRALIRTHTPGDTIKIETLSGNERVTHLVTLDERNGQAYLGIGFSAPPQGKISAFFYTILSYVKDPFVYYEPNYEADLAWFVYHLLWWMVIINFSVALMNMLPVGIFDGGRFFYLTIWGLTGKEKIGRYAFAAATYAILAVFVWLTFRWIFVYF